MCRCCSCSQLQKDMSKPWSELSEKERELLKIRRTSGAKASQLAQMEKMLQETKSMIDKKTEMGTEGNPFEDNMGLYQSSHFLFNGQ